MLSITFSPCALAALLRPPSPAMQAEAGGDTFVCIGTQRPGWNVAGPSEHNLRLYGHEPCSSKKWAEAFARERAYRDRPAEAVSCGPGRGIPPGTGSATYVAERERLW